ncbi:MAG: hypothetical protein F6K31_04065 [Symploca sp. SIO2G7]|nr:hypothetical protein [Symploca sp. SIO2G7]
MATAFMGVRNKSNSLPKLPVALFLRAWRNTSRRVSEKKGGELGELGELRKKRELIIFGYKAQEIPPKISPHPFAPPIESEKLSLLNTCHLPPTTYHLSSFSRAYN